MIVVGAGRGIGRQTAAAMVQSGARVLCCDLDADTAHDVAAEVGGIAWVGDATRRDDVARLAADASDALGRIDGFVDVVGMAHYGSVLDTDEEQLRWQMDIVLGHAVLLSRYLGKAMLSGGGSMVFISSLSGITASPQTAAYGAAKSALMSWIRSTADELGPSGIRVNGVAPGMVWTPRVESLIGEPGRPLIEAVTPLRRVARPADIAGVALFLMTDLASFVTGQTIVVDGGASNAFPYPMAAFAELAGLE